MTYEKLCLLKFFSCSTRHYSIATALCSYNRRWTICLIRFWQHVRDRWYMGVYRISVCTVCPRASKGGVVPLRHYRRHPVRLRLALFHTKRAAGGFCSALWCSSRWGLRAFHHRAVPVPGFFLNSRGECSRTATLQLYQHYFTCFFREQCRPHKKRCETHVQHG